MPDEHGRAIRRHNIGCTLFGVRGDEPIDYEKHCYSFHCGWCGEPCSSHGCWCEWRERGEVRPDDDVTPPQFGFGLIAESPSYPEED